MSDFSKEADMSPMVADWLREQGYTVYAEIPGVCCGAYAYDLVGLKAGQPVVVEMKLSLTWKVIQQAHLATLDAFATWAAVPTRPRQGNFREAMRAGIGVLRVTREGCEVLHQAPWKEPYHKDNFARRLVGCTPSDDGGHPNLAGTGPAQSVAKDLREYLKAHPGAKWREIFEAVPNHYAHAKSMSQAMQRHRAVWEATP